LGASARVELVEGHYQVTVVEGGGYRLYSIDFHALLPARPGECGEPLRAGGPAGLCYLRLPGGCEAVVLETPGRVEVISLRIRVDPGGDPFGGSARRALEHCWRLASRELGVEPPGGVLA
jgi:hypothetical protein